MNGKIKRKPAYYSISAVAEMFEVHPQTIRLYEKQGLVHPKRSEGGTRMYSDEDIDKLEEVIYLTNKLGVNIAGVELVIKLKKQISKMQKEMNQLFEKTQQELSDTAQESKLIVEQSAQRLIRIKESENMSRVLPITPIPASQRPELSETIDVDMSKWEIEYEND
jgi:MerR family transcriptional regulator/heat shock protein HspR